MKNYRVRPLKIKRSNEVHPIEYKKQFVNNLKDKLIPNHGISERIRALPIIHATTKKSSMENYKSNELDDYKIGIEIGRGLYSVVKSAIQKSTGKRVAIKIYKKSKLTSLQRRKCLEQEIKVMKLINHPNIVKLYEVIETVKEIYIIMEFVKGRSLLSYIKSQPGKKLSERESAWILHQVLEGIKYCHEYDIAHRDIKMENIILDESLNAKIIDFGFSGLGVKDKKLKAFCGTPSYMPPEIITKKEYYGPAVDMWSIGILLYVMLCGYFPFRGGNEKELFREITIGICSVPLCVSEAGKRLIVRLLRYDPDRRLTAEEAIKDPFIINNLTNAYHTHS